MFFPNKGWSSLMLAYFSKSPPMAETNGDDLSPETSQHLIKFAVMSCI